MFHHKVQKSSFGNNAAPKKSSFLKQANSWTNPYQQSNDEGSEQPANIVKPRTTEEWLKDNILLKAIETRQAQLQQQAIQTKLTVGEPGDKYEQEADTMASRVMSMRDQTVQRLLASGEIIQTKPLANGFTPIVQRAARPEMGGTSQDNGNLENRLNRSKGGGRPLPNDVRSFMEPRFGANFSQVRVHTGSEAVQMSRELGAQAFTHGSDVYYGAGKSPGNNELTAHELTHVVQQTGTIQRQNRPPQPGPWNPPGKQPIPFYIGTEAHLGIVAQYIANHLGDVVFTNFITISTILKAFQKMGLNPNIGALSQKDLALKPDILNASRHHLYEIKPDTAQNQALNEAQMYARLFAAAGITIALGPINEPGTRGMIPAPGGFYVFWSPVPGVIVYKYGRQPQPARQPVRQPVQQPVQQQSQDPDFMQKMSAITGLTGTALIIYLILSEGSRAFPPRNLIPIP